MFFSPPFTDHRQYTPRRAIIDKIRKILSHLYRNTAAAPGFEFDHPTINRHLRWRGNTVARGIGAHGNYV